jgi:hypothetical protein
LVQGPDFGLPPGQIGGLTVGCKITLSDLLENPVPGPNKYKTLTLWVGRVSKIETVKYGNESCGTQA